MWLWMMKQWIKYLKPNLCKHSKLMAGLGLRSRSGSKIIFQFIRIAVYTRFYNNQTFNKSTNTLLPNSFSHLAGFTGRICGDRKGGLLIEPPAWPMINHRQTHTPSTFECEPASLEHDSTNPQYWYEWIAMRHAIETQWKERDWKRGDMAKNNLKQLNCYKLLWYQFKLV